ncbi:MAG: aldose epimerase family protein [Akkermansiaceae bacterium]
MSLLHTIQPAAAEASISLKQFGEIDGQAVTLFTLRNENGMIVEISEYGGAVVSLIVPDRDGKMENVVLGFDTLEAYIDDTSYFGTIIGRNSNRIAEAKFKLDEKLYQLAANNGPNNFHGGTNGFNKKIWQGSPAIANGEPALTLQYISPDGEEGFPGELRVITTYTLTKNNELKIDYSATTDKPTLCNLTHHSYWNIGGPSSNSILDQKIQFFSDFYTPTDETCIPTGEMRHVEGTPFDFRTPHQIGSRINEPDQQLIIGKGYDHNFIVKGTAGTLRPMVRLSDAASGRVLEMLSTDHGVQFYTGNYLDGSIKGKQGKEYTHRLALNLECQQLPDAINQPAFKATVLHPGETYNKTTIYRFSIQQ